MIIGSNLYVYIIIPIMLREDNSKVYECSAPLTGIGCKLRVLIGRYLPSQNGRAAFTI